MRRISMVIVGVVALIALLAADPARTTVVAKGSFEVTLQPDGEPETADGVSLGRMTLDKTFTGDLAGIEGSFTLTIVEGKHLYEFAYSLPRSAP